MWVYCSIDDITLQSDHISSLCPGSSSTETKLKTSLYLAFVVESLLKVGIPCRGEFPSGMSCCTKEAIDSSETFDANFKSWGSLLSENGFFVWRSSCWPTCNASELKYGFLHDSEHWVPWDRFFVLGLWSRLSFVITLPFRESIRDAWCILLLRNLILGW